MSDEKEYVKISQLDEVVNPAEGSLVMVSEVVGAEGNYVSRKMQLDTMKQQIKDGVIAGIDAATESMATIEQCRTLDGIRRDSNLSAIVVVQAAREMYSALEARGGAPQGNFLVRDTDAQQTVKGAVQFQSQLSCSTPPSPAASSIMNYAALSAYHKEAEHPLVCGTPPQSEEYSTGSNKGITSYIIGTPTQCAVNIRIHAGAATNIGIAVFCNPCVVYDTYDKLLSLARNAADDRTTDTWHPLEYVSLAKGGIYTKTFPCKKDTVFMFYDIKKAPAGVTGEDLMDNATTEAFPPNTQFVVDFHKFYGTREG